MYNILILAFGFRALDKEHSIQKSGNINTSLFKDVAKYS